MPPPNFAKVDDRLWRGARPDLNQANWLVNEGVRTVINLEWEHGDDAAFDESLNRVRLLRLRDFEPLPWFAPSLETRHVVEVLAAVRRTVPITYVHCRSGQNRTGVAAAAYRLVELGDPLPAVLADFESYRGAWAWGDSFYIRGISKRLGTMRCLVDRA